MSNVSFHIEPGGRLNGECHVPGDKSISHRAIILGSLAKGTTRINGFLDSLDCLVTLNAFKQMGVHIEHEPDGEVVIHGVGMHGLMPSDKALDLGNSGTSMRLLAGLLCAQPFDSILTGDASLMQRPMDRIITPLTKMGAKIEGTASGCAPLVITGDQLLTGISYRAPMASAQLKSCLLLAGLYAQGETKLLEAAVTRDHTERMLTSFGFPIKKADRSVSLYGGGVLNAIDMTIPGDLSSAAFYLVAACITPNSYLVIKNVCINPTRTGVIRILKLMGADIELCNKRLCGDEPVADIHVKSSCLEGIDIPQESVSLAIDEFPIIFIAAAAASGQTVIKGAKELRVKESDRILTMIDGLQSLGIHAEALIDGAIINGGTFNGGIVDSHGDHRVSMAFSVAGMVAMKPITVLNCANVLTSFPNFVVLSTQLGMTILEK